MVGQTGVNADGERDEVVVQLLDGVHLFVAGQEVDLRGDRARALLARLAMARGSSVPREVLIEDVWSGGPARSGAGELRAQIKRLRDRLAPLGLDQLVETTATGYRLANRRSYRCANV